MPRTEREAHIGVSDLTEADELSAETQAYPVAPPTF